MAGKKAKDKLTLSQRENVWRFVFRVNMAIEEMIERAGIPKKELAGILGVSPARISHLSDLEQDHRISTIAKILEALGVDYELILKLNNLQLRISPDEKHVLRFTPVLHLPESSSYSLNFPITPEKSGGLHLPDSQTREVIRAA